MCRLTPHVPSFTMRPLLSLARSTVSYGMTGPVRGPGLTVKFGSLKIVFMEKSLARPYVFDLVTTWLGDIGCARGFGSLVWSYRRLHRRSGSLPRNLHVTYLANQKAFLSPRDDVLAKLPSIRYTPRLQCPKEVIAPEHSFDETKACNKTPPVLWGLWHTRRVVKVDVCFSQERYWPMRDKKGRLHRQTARVCTIGTLFEVLSWYSISKLVRWAC